MFAGPAAYLGASSGASGAAGAGAASLFTPLTVGLGVGLGGLALFDALEKQKQAKKAMNAAAMGASGQLSAIQGNLQLALFENANRRAQLVGRTTTTLSAKGGLGGVTAKNLLNEAVANAALADYYTRFNANNQSAQVRAGYESTAASIRGSTPGLAPAAIGGAFQGFSQGLALQTALDNLEQANRVGANPGRYA